MAEKCTFIDERGNKCQAYRIHNSEFCVAHTKVMKVKAEKPKEPKEEKSKDGWPDVKVLKDWDRVDPLKLTAQDPEYAYRWLRDKADNISLKTSNDPNIGYWRLVPTEHLDALEKRDKIEILRASDGLCRKGDLILAYMPKKFYLARQEIKKKKAKAPMEMVNRKLKEGIPGATPGIVGGGIKTEKQLGMEGKDYRR